MLPSGNKVSSPYGWRTHPITGKRSFHTGQDHSYIGPTGRVIVAPQSGRITFDGSYGGYGEAMILEAGTTRHLFAHTLLVDDANVGDWVVEGQPIATIGSTGNSTGPHLHWEVQVNNARMDPAAWAATPSGAPKPIGDDMTPEQQERVYKSLDTITQLLTDFSAAALPAIGRQENDENVIVARVDSLTQKVIDLDAAVLPALDELKATLARPSNGVIDLRPLLEAIQALPGDTVAALKQAL